MQTTASKSNQYSDKPKIEYYVITQHECDKNVLSWFLSILSLCYFMNQTWISMETKLLHCQYDWDGWVYKCETQRGGLMKL